MVNRLARSTSPYLLQHADNPVDWWEWSPDAFAEARRRDVPVLLSVGYASCHWCHVMAHESFEDETVADVLREGFVAVKVDREERPDVDAAYMSATMALTGQGGWPMTCLLTPDGTPFWAGTYLPRIQLLRLLDAASTAWRSQRDQVTSSAARVAEALHRVAQPPARHPLDEEALEQAVGRLRAGYDEARGGFGGAPKFPPSMVLEFLLRHHARTGDADALAMVERTCEAMARGGLYDQLAGGFARYAVDADWVVPHFEKMLYDNAQLLGVYAHWWRATTSPLAERVVRETAGFLLEALLTPEGAFASSLDADTVVDGRGVEGATYVWTRAQLEEVLGAGDGGRAADLMSVTPRGTFEHGASTLQLRRDPDEADLAWWETIRGRLREARADRPQPARDDKVVTAWNGLAIAALADAGCLMGEPSWVAAAARCARFLLGTHVVDGRLRRVSRAGTVGSAAGVADDHGNLAAGLLALHQATGEPSWLEEAGHLLEVALAHFGDGVGGFSDTADDAEELFTRPPAQGDNAEPSGTSALAGALLTYAALTGSTPHREAAEAALGTLGDLPRREPRFAGWALAVAEAAATGPLQVAVVGADDAGALASAARRSTSPGLVVVHGAPDAAGVPLLADRPLVSGRPAAYVCRGFVCDAPVTDVESLRAALAGPAQAGPARAGDGQGGRGQAGTSEARSSASQPDIPGRPSR